MTHVLLLLSVGVLRCNTVRPTIEENDNADSKYLGNNGTSVTASGHLQSHKPFSLSLRRFTKKKPERPEKDSNSTSALTAQQDSRVEHENIALATRRKTVTPVRPNASDEFTGHLSAATVQDEFARAQNELSAEETRTDAITIKRSFDDEEDPRGLQIYRLVRPDSGGDPEGEHLRDEPNSNALETEWKKKLLWNHYFAGRELNPPKSDWMEAYVRVNGKPTKFYLRKRVDPVNDIVQLVNEEDEDVDGPSPIHHPRGPRVEDSSYSAVAASTKGTPEEEARKRHRAFLTDPALPRYTDQTYTLEDPRLDDYIGKELADETNRPYEPPRPGGQTHHFKEYEAANEQGLVQQANIFMGHGDRLKNSAQDARAGLHNLQFSVDKAKDTLDDLESRMVDASDQIRKEYQSYQNQARSGFNVADDKIGSPRDMASLVDSHWKDDHLDDDELNKHGQKYLANGDLDLFKDDAYPSEWKVLDFMQEVPKPDSWRPPGAIVEASSGSRKDDDEAFPNANDEE